MTTETNDTPPAINLPALIERLRKRAEEDRQCEVNNRIVSELLQPQLDAFDKRDGSHNTYAVRVQLNHRNSAKRDEQYADDLEAVVALLAASPEPRGRHLPSREEIAVTIQRIEESGVRIPDGYADGHVAGVARIDHSEVSDWSAFMADRILSLLRGDTANGGEG